ncbi:MAG: Hpt domain-containing protein, partial [Pseudomonas sp.]
MSFGADEEILQDFLVEAGEILEQLSEQLVELESRPDDMNLLNAIFRGFHTVKGGAGFLQLNELVECCHIAENVFDILRKGSRRVDSELMDVVLEALDAVNGMFTEVRERVELTPATPQLLAALARLAEPASAVELAAVVAPEPQVAPEPEAEAEGDITDNEFEQLLDALAEPAPAVEAAPLAASGDEITDDEFEALLDQLHGKGQFVAPTEEAAPAQVVAPVAAASGDEITDDEFEALLDQLHGKGQFVAGNDEPAAVVAPSAESSSENITDDEFEALLDQLHGKGKFVEPAAAAPVAPAPAAAVAKPAESKP